MTPDLQTRLGLYRDRIQLMAQLAGLPSLQVQRLLRWDEPLVDAAVGAGLYDLDHLPFATLPVEATRDDYARWVQHVVQAVPLGDRFFVALGYRYLPWVAVQAVSPAWIDEVLAAVGDAGFAVIDGARTTHWAFHVAEYAYEALIDHLLPAERQPPPEDHV